MIVLFCEVPRAEERCRDYEDPARAPAFDKLVAVSASDKSPAGDGHESIRGCPAADIPAAKRLRTLSDGTTRPVKKEKTVKLPKPSAYVGKTNHLRSAWVDIADIRRAADSQERAPVISMFGREARCFPLSIGAFRAPEARAWIDE